MRACSTEMGSIEVMFDLATVILHTKNAKNAKNSRLTWKKSLKWKANKIGYIPETGDFETWKYRKRTQAHDK